MGLPIDQPAHASLMLDAGSEAELVDAIYGYAHKKSDWFRLIVGLSKCIGLTASFADNHPVQGMLRRLSTHLSNAVSLCARLSELEQESQLQRSLLDQVPLAAGILDDAGNLVAINRKAQAEIAQSQDWILSKQTLQARHLNLGATLKRVALSEEQFASVPFEHASHTTSLMHLTRIPPQGGDGAAMYYFCIQQEPAPLLAEDVLRNVYQLTKTEALVARTVMTEISTKRTAERLNLQPATVRDHLSQIYIKLDVDKKSELIRKLLWTSLLGASPAPPRVTAADGELRPRHILLRDGRRLSYMDIWPSVPHESSPPQAVILMHNLMGSAFEMPPGGQAALNRLNVRLIVPERPGFGDSDPLPDRSVFDFSADMEALLAHLQIDRFKIMGYSSGGAYALALACGAAASVERVSLIAPLARVEDFAQLKTLPPPMKSVLLAIRYAPFLIPIVMRLSVGRGVERFYEQQLRSEQPTRARKRDERLLNSPVYRQYGLKNLSRSMKQGSQIWAKELQTVLSPWQFPVADVRAPCQIWLGRHDDFIPEEAVRRMAESLTVTEFNLMEDETHLIFSRYFGRALAALVA